MCEMTPYGLIGRKLGHSDSPAIHAAFGNPDYLCYPMEPEALPDFLAQPHLKGLNVTIPYKITVMPFCKRLDPLAEAIGSVNTMVREADGSWTGYNTDAYGFRYLMRNAGLSFAGAKVLILGNGGASQTVQALAKLDGAQRIIVGDLKGEYTYDDLPRFTDSTLIINATPVGMYPIKFSTASMGSVQKTAHNRPMKKPYRPPSTCRQSNVAACLPQANNPTPRIPWTPA